MSDKLFRTNMFGGYNKEDVQLYIARLEAEVVRLQEADSTRREPLEKTRAEDQEGTAKPEENAEEDVFVLDALSEGLERNSTDIERGAELEKARRELEQVKSELLDTRQELESSRRLCEESRKRLQFVSDEKGQLEDEVDKLRERQSNYEKDYEAVKEVLLNARIDAEIIRTKARKEAELLLENTQKRIMEQKKESASELLRHLTENCDGLLISKTYLKEQVNSIERTEKQIKELKSKIEDFMEEDILDEGI